MPIPGSDLALVLSGGGARSAYQVGVLAAIAERRPDLRIDILTGVSAGAINATFLAAHPGPLAASVDALRQQWARLTSEEVYSITPPGLLRGAARLLSRVVFSPSAEQAKVRGLMDLRPLRAFLTNCIRFEQIQTNIDSGRLRALALSSTSYASGSTVTFVHGAADIPTWERAQRIAVRTRIGLDHVMASSAIPLVFPAVKLDDGFYGDGSVRQTAPLAPAIHLGARRVLAIGMRAWRPSSTPVRPPSEYPTTAEVLGLLLHAIFLDALDADIERLERMNRMLDALGPLETPPDQLRRVDLLVVRPSRDLGTLAENYREYLPKAVKLLMRPIGGYRATASDFLSYLLFEPAFTGTLVELGYEDGRAQWGSIEEFLDRIG